MNSSSLVGLMNNAALLIALGLLYDILGVRQIGKNPTFRQMFAGAVIGAIGIAIMSTPWNFGHGVIFDTRSVLLCIAGLFFGTLPTLIAVILTAAFRLSTGGAGAWVGVAVIGTSGAVGLAWRHLRRRRDHDPSTGELYLLGIVVHVAMLAWMLLLPGTVAPSVLQNISLPVMLIHPMATVLLGVLLVNRKRRTEAEHRLRTSEAKFRHLFEHHPAVKLLIDPDNGRIVQANRAAETFYGWPVKQIQGMAVHDINTLPADQVRAEMEKARSREKSHFSFKHRLADNSIRDVEVYSGKVRIGGKAYLHSIVHDVSDSRRAVEALRESEDKYRRLAENMSDVVWITDFDLRTTYVSPSVERLVGEPVEAHLKRSFEEKFPPDSLNTLIHTFAEEMEREKDPGCDRKRSRMIEVEHYRADGSTVWVSIHCSFVRDANGTPVGLQGVTRDISERRAAEESMRHANDLMRYVVEHANSGVAVHDRDLRYIYVSQRYLDQYKIAEQEVIGRHHYDVFPDLPQKWRHVHQRALAGEVSRADRDPYPREDGTLEWTRWECRPWYAADGTIGGIIVYTEVITGRVRTEEALRASEEQQRSMIAASPLAIISLDAQGVVQSWNDSAERIFGWPAHEAMGRFLPLVPEDQYAHFAGLRRRVMAGESLANVELTRRRRDGSAIEVSLSTAPIRDQDGRPAAIMAVLEDITERKKAEKRLNWNIQRNALLSQTAARLLQSDVPQDIVEDLCRRIMEFLDCHVFFNFVLDAQSGKLQLNAYAGIPAENAGQIEWLDQGVAVCGGMAHDRRRRVYENIQEAADPVLDKVKSWGIQAYGCHPLMVEDRLIGTLSFGTRSRPRFAPEEIEMMESVTHLVATAMNRVHMERALRASEEKFRLLVENSPDAIFIQTEGRFAYLNQGAINLFGARSADELLGTDIMDRFHPDFHEAVRERIRSLNQRKEQVPILEQIYLRMDGSPVNVEVSAVPFNHQGQDGAIVFARDITERIERQKANEYLQKQLVQAQKMESVGRLAGGVAHDYNNMLGVILGYSEMLLEMFQPSDAAHSALVEIKGAAQRSADITRQLLAFARKQTISPKVLDLNDTVAGMLKMLRRLIGEDIELAWRPEAPLWPVKLDPSQVDQILANLCVNARDAIAGVGKVTIETENVRFDAPYRAEHPGFREGEFVLLAVSDDGCGMDRETLQNIFEPFFTTKADGHGTGLGLAMVYGIVKQNEGFVNVYSEPGKGTTFRIYLPRHQGQIKEAIHEEAPAQTPKSQGETILLVEDEEPLLKLEKRMLQRLDYDVLCASTPRAAMDLAAQHGGRINLLITDVVMPEMSGRELSERLTARYPGLKTLYMSGYTANVIAHRGILKDGVNFMQKPFSMQELAVKLSAVLKHEHE